MRLRPRRGAAWIVLTDLRTLEQAVAAAQVVGFPLMVKASEGGGGKGIRKVEAMSELEAAFRQVRCRPVRSRRSVASVGVWCSVVQCSAVQCSAAPSACSWPALLRAVCCRTVPSRRCVP
jgi:hypothetical protein